MVFVAIYDEEKQRLVTYSSHQGFTAGAVAEVGGRKGLTFESYRNKDYDFLLRNESIGLKEYVRNQKPGKVFETHQEGKSSKSNSEPETRRSASSREAEGQIIPERRRVAKAARRISNDAEHRALEQSEKQTVVDGQGGPTWPSTTPTSALFPNAAPAQSALQAVAPGLSFGPKAQAVPLVPFQLNLAL